MPTGPSVYTQTGQPRSLSSFCLRSPLWSARWSACHRSFDAQVGYPDPDPRNQRGPLPPESPCASRQRPLGHRGAAPLRGPRGSRRSLCGPPILLAAVVDAVAAQVDEVPLHRLSSQESSAQRLATEGRRIAAEAGLPLGPIVVASFVPSWRRPALRLPGSIPGVWLPRVLGKPRVPGRLAVWPQMLSSRRGCRSILHPRTRGSAELRDVAE